MKFNELCSCCDENVKEVRAQCLRDWELFQEYTDLMERFQLLMLKTDILLMDCKPVDPAKSEK